METFLATRRMGGGRGGGGRISLSDEPAFRNCARFYAGNYFPVSSYGIPLSTSDRATDNRVTKATASYAAPMLTAIDRSIDRPCSLYVVAGKFQTDVQSRGRKNAAPASQRATVNASAASNGGTVLHETRLGQPASFLPSQDKKGRVSRVLIAFLAGSHCAHPSTRT